MRKNEGHVVINMEGGWILHHYHPKERNYLGRMVLQPKNHRLDFCDLCLKEAQTLGTNIQHINSALRHYWEKRFHEDPIERVYVAYFNEAIPPSMHVHLLPRTRKMRGKGSANCVAWNIVHLLDSGAYPDDYKIEGNVDEEKKVVHLMNYLKRFLSEC